MTEPRGTTPARQTWNPAGGWGWAAALTLTVLVGLAGDRPIRHARAEDAARVRWPLASGRAEIRAPFAGSEIVVGASSRTAGAIDSVVWREKEFINAFDHGRELQSAASFDGEGECLNPTEAGSARDFTGARSTSLLLDLRAGPNWLETRSRMAFWYDPAQLARMCAGRVPRYGAARSDYGLVKRVVIGSHGVPNAIEYRATFQVPNRFTSGQFEALTGYMPPEFSRFWAYDPARDRLSPLSDGPGEQDRPVILATPDGAYAMGVFSPDLPVPDYPAFGYGRFRFVDTDIPGNATVKWNCVFRRPEGEAGDHTFRCFALIGTLNDVRRGMAALSQALRR